MVSSSQDWRNLATCCGAIKHPRISRPQNNGLASGDFYGVPPMDRRTVLAALGAVAAAGSPLRGQEVSRQTPHWGAPVIDMHFHMRATPELNIAHQQGAGITAANLLARRDTAA